jgi:hypothetical protein
MVIYRQTAAVTYHCVTLVRSGLPELTGTTVAAAVCLTRVDVLMKHHRCSDAFYVPQATPVLLALQWLQLINTACCNYPFVEGSNQLSTLVEGGEGAGLERGGGCGVWGVQLGGEGGVGGKVVQLGGVQLWCGWLP